MVIWNDYWNGSFMGTGQCSWLKSQYCRFLHTYLKTDHQTQLSSKMHKATGLFSSFPDFKRHTILHFYNLATFEILQCGPLGILTKCSRILKQTVFLHLQARFCALWKTWFESLQQCNKKFSFSNLGQFLRAVRVFFLAKTAPSIYLDPERMPLSVLSCLRWFACTSNKK